MESEIISREEEEDVAKLILSRVVNDPVKRRVGETFSWQAYITQFPTIARNPKLVHSSKMCGVERGWWRMVAGINGSENLTLTPVGYVEGKIGPVSFEEQKTR